MKYFSEVFLVLMLFAVSVFSDDPELNIQSKGSLHEVKRSGRQYPPGCTPEYRKFKKVHTMCLTDSKDVSSSGVSKEDETLLVNLHNKLRSGVSPAAKGLTKVIWDNKVAVIAQKWAKQCNFAHDAERRVPSYATSIGQNVAYGYVNWTATVMGWYNEVEIFRFGVNPETYLGVGGWAYVAHYTQIAQNSLSRIGCGYARCGTANIHVCNYAPGQYNIATPYIKGTKCAACRSRCRNNLCDCGGKMCFNGGKLNLDTCKCKCRKNTYGDSCQNLVCGGLKCKHTGQLNKKTCKCKCPRAYVGKDCSILQCKNVQDDSSCQWYSMENCRNWFNVPPMCPLKCGLCK